MKKVLAVLSGLVVTCSAPSQSIFQKLFNAGGGDVLKLSDNGFLIAGSMPADTTQVCLIRTDLYGDTLWTRTLGTSRDMVASSIHPTLDGGFIISGNCFSFQTLSDVFMIKTDSSGVPLWVRSFGTPSGDEYIANVIPVSTGGYLLAASSTLAFGTLYLVRTDENGNQMWYQHFGNTNGSLYASAVNQLVDGSLMISGYTDLTGNLDAFLMNTDSSGNLNWAKRYHGGADDYISFGHTTSDGGYIMAGEICGSFCDVYLLKTDATGNPEWSKKYGGSLDDFAWYVSQADDGGYAICGGTESFGASAADFYIVKTDSSGNVEWSDRTGGSDNDVAHIIKQAGDGGFITLGYSYSFGGPLAKMYVVKSDSSGFSGCSSSVPPTITTVLNTMAYNFTVTTYSINNVDTLSFTIGSGSGSDSLLCQFTSSINETHSLAENAQIFPNPASNILNIQLPSEAEAVIEIISLLGQSVFSTKRNSDQLSIDLSTIDAGVYYVQIRTVNNLYSEKILIIR